MFKSIRKKTSGNKLKKKKGDKNEQTTTMEHDSSEAHVAPKPEQWHLSQTVEKCQDRPGKI